LKRVLVTGAAGSIGQILRAGLSDQYEVYGLDVTRGKTVDRVANSTKPRQLAREFEGVTAVVDLAADSSAFASWDSVRNNNIPATLNALEAARQAGVARVVYASSNHVVGMYEKDEPYASVVAGRYAGLDPDGLPRIGSDAPIRPDGAYGVGKALGEAAGRYYAEAHGLSVLCLRIGTVNRADRPENARHFATLLTHRDLLQLVRCCLDAPPSVSWGIYYGVSANTWRIWDIDEARSAVGYEPEDDTEHWR
jgi:nucleoside-diphosphate-sugar epimerase